MTYDFDLCDNEYCPKRLECERYKLYKQGDWSYCYIMSRCVGYKHFKPISNYNKPKQNNQKIHNND